MSWKWKNSSRCANGAGFIFQSSEIYGGLNGFWDYGPLGVELKRNVKEAWWRDMISGHDDLATLPGAPSPYEMTALDCTIIMHPQVWKCSGHYDLFHDFMVDCRERRSATGTTRSAAAGSTAKGKRIFVATELGGDEGLAETEAAALKFFNLRAKDVDELAWRRPAGVADHGRRISPRCWAPTPRNWARSPRRANST